jgi:hypothetical protein
MKNEKKVQMGKTSRKQGKAFELKVRKDLMEKGWICDRWSNNVEFGPGDVVVDTTFMDSKKGIVGKALCNSGKLIPAKHQYNPFTKAMSAGNGFPDFICFKRINILNRSIGENDYTKGFEHGFKACYDISGFEVQLVECKMNGKLDKIEKEKIDWLKQNLNIRIYVAKKGIKKGEITYDEQ